ncbi:hypothetical protein BDZ97DRAFT_1177620 [Flammula alnicola]|nr:hypothetical protein BDZ97DRAFT_1177620 [Flammula alnicola]
MVGTYIDGIRQLSDSVRATLQLQGRYQSSYKAVHERFAQSPMASLSSTSLTSTVQPPPIPNGRDLSMVEAAPVLNQSTPAEKPRVFRRVRPGLRRVAKITADIFAVLFIGLIYGLPGALFVGIVAVLMIGLSFGVIAADGAIALFVTSFLLSSSTTYTCV